MGAYNVISPSAMAAGQPEDISVVLANLQAIATVLNGGIDNSNINVAAGIVASKLNGYPADSSKVLLGDGTWSTLVTGPGAPVTALPGSPTDKMQVIFTDSVTTPTYWWLMQYSSTLGYWINLGGNGWLQAVGSGSYPSVTVPRAGDYMCQIGGRALAIGATLGQTVDMAITAGGTTLNAYAGQGSGQNNSDYSSCYDSGRMNGLTTSQVLTPSGTNVPTGAYIRIQPVKMV
jgi:hypothetical protein